MRLAAGQQEDEIDRAVEEIGMAFQISTRLTSWVAVSEERTVDPTKPVRREQMPQQLPYGMSAEGLGLRATSFGAAARMPAPAAAVGLMPPSLMRERTRMAASEPPAAKRRGKSWLAGILRSESAGAPPPSTPWPTRPPSLPEEPLGRGALDEEALLPERRLAATLRRAGRGRAVLEVQVTGAELAWEPPTTVTLRLDDGTEPEVEVDLSASTAGATLAPGQAFRLVLRIPAKIATERVAEVSVACGETPLVLSVRH
jgi:hypothetical protein